jgi:hypothetical protein
MTESPSDHDPSWSYYPKTVLYLHGPHEIAIDLRSSLPERVRVILSTLEDSNQFAVVTASNPHGIEESAEANERRLETLSDELERSGARKTFVTGASPDGAHREEGFAAWIPCEQARELAARYEQTAFFWFDGREFWVVPSHPDSRSIRLPIG